MMQEKQKAKEYTSATEDIFINLNAWEEEYLNVKNRLSEFKDKYGDVNNSSILFYMLKDKFEIEKNLEALNTYAVLEYDKDRTNEQNRELQHRARILKDDASKILSKAEKVILSLKDEELNNPVLEDYRLYINNVKRFSRYGITPSEEKIISNFESMSVNFENTASLILFKDMKFKDVIMPNGTSSALTNNNFGMYSVSNDREVRRQAHINIYSEYEKYLDVMAANLSASVKLSNIAASSRNFENDYELYMYRENIDKSLYDKLLSATKKNIGLFHRYMALRKKSLNLEKLSVYDVQVPMIKSKDIKMPYEQVKKLMAESLSIIGEDYQKQVQKAFDERWIDLPETPGKYTMPYTTAVYGVHPYINMGYNDTMANASTLVHEMGHAMHFFYSNSSQLYQNSKFSIFISEVIALFHDWNFMKYIIENTDDADIKLQYISHLLEQYRKMYFIMTMFAEFEMEIHKCSAKGTDLTADFLCGLFKRLAEEYYGPDVEIDRLYLTDWMRYVHFYSNFYFYKYAAGLACAVCIYSNLNKDTNSLKEEFKNVLKSAGTLSPFELLKKVGVDISSEKPFELAMKEFENLIDQYEKLAQIK